MTTNSKGNCGLTLATSSAIRRHCLVFRKSNLKVVPPGGFHGNSCASAACRGPAWSHSGRAVSSDVVFLNMPLMTFNPVTEVANRLYRLKPQTVVTLREWTKV